MDLPGRISIGTAQFGMDYGVANAGGRLSRETVFSMLEEALREGVSALDTASSYGESEAVIGEFLSRSGKDMEITGKLPPLDLLGVADVGPCLRRTLEKLGRDQIYGYLVHRFENMRDHEGLWEEMKRMKDAGSVRKIGFSIYRTEELDYLLDEEVDIDIIQLPYNVFDRRFEAYFPALKEMGAEIHVRSVFLQGLFFLGMDRIEKDFVRARDAIALLKDISRKEEIPLQALCLCFALLDAAVDKVVVGMDSVGQFRENIDSARYMDRVRGLKSVMRDLKFHDESVILPYNWR